MKKKTAFILIGGILIAASSTAKNLCYKKANQLRSRCEEKKAEMYRTIADVISGITNLFETIGAFAIVVDRVF